jgi:hypothetical protein
VFGRIEKRPKKRDRLRTWGKSGAHIVIAFRVQSYPKGGEGNAHLSSFPRHHFPSWVFRDTPWGVRLRVRPIIFTLRASALKSSGYAIEQHLGWFTQVALHLLRGQPSTERVKTGSGTLARRRVHTVESPSHVERPVWSRWRSAGKITPTNSSISPTMNPPITLTAG